MCIHVLTHICRNQRNEDKGGKRVQAYLQGYAYINRHRDIGFYEICRKKKKENEKAVRDIKQNTKQAARALQIYRQVENTTYTQDTDSQKQANRQGRCVRETEVSIGKAPRLGFHTPKFKRDFQNVMPSDNVITFSESKYNADPELNSRLFCNPKGGQYVWGDNTH